MAIKARDKSMGGTDFEICPTGLQHAVCVDVIDLGEVETPFIDERTGQKKIQHQIKIVWQVDAVEEDGTPARRTDGLMHRLSKFYTLSLNEKANLRKDLDRWRGKPFTDEELADGWDVEAVIGADCQVNVFHKASGDKTYANVESVLARPRGAPKLQPEEYTREKDVPGGKDTRSPAGDGGSSNSGYDSYEDTKDEEPPLPF